MFLTGFADEASHDPALQIKATKELGWKYIEARFVGEKFLADISDGEFDRFCAMLEEAGIGINCYGSGVANWSKSPRSEEDFAATRAELLRAIPRMKRLGIGMIRGMSFKVADGEPFDSPELESIIFRKVGELVKICEDNGIVYGHENCANYAGQSFKHTLKLLDNVRSPNLKLIFDTGNPCFTFRRIGAPPYPLQSAREFYENVREFICHVHIKDAVSVVNPDGTVSTTYKYAGEGNGDIPWIVTDLLKRGYDGGFSMEPHVAVVFHEKDDQANSAAMAQKRYDAYVDYGRRFEKLLSGCKAEAAGEK